MQLDLAETARLDADPTTDAGPGGPVQQLSVDGVFVPLVGGEWSEVKVLAVGAVVADTDDGVMTTDRSYRARLADHERFGREALAELHRRGTLTAQTVVAVQDGADWIQGFLDLHVPGAVRVLDFAHAAGYLGQAARAAFGPSTREANEWLEKWLHELKHGDPDRVLAALAALAASEAREDAPRYLPPAATRLRMPRFRRRATQLAAAVSRAPPNCWSRRDYAGRGCTGPRARRCAAWTAHDPWDQRWEAAWGQITTQLRQQTRQNAGARRTRRREARTPSALPPPTAALPPVMPEAVLRLRQEERVRPKRIVNGCPTADHPYKRTARSRPSAARLPCSQNSDAHPRPRLTNLTLATSAP